MKCVVTLLFAWAAGFAFGQKPADAITLNGTVRDLRTGEPLAYATISLSVHIEMALSGSDGKFKISLPSPAASDTLRVSYIGYGDFKIRVSEIHPDFIVSLSELYSVLPAVSIDHRQLDVRDIDRNVRKIRGALYAMNTEVTNAQYNFFLSKLESSGQVDKLKSSGFDLSQYPKASREFYRQYHQERPAVKPTGRKDTSGGYSNFPAVNISHEGAEEYCRWLTDQYNKSPKRRKFRKVTFRLPTLQEWQIMALGYPDFQSWNLMENQVEARIPKDTLMSDMLIGEKAMIPMTDRVLYPWYGAYNYRYKAQNHKNCFLGNFYIESAIPCPARNQGFDGWIMLGRVGTYFPNNMGFYDVVGNAAEMIDIPGDACGGSWKDTPRNSTLQSIKKYSSPDESVGFRIFMEVVEK